jgi:hypothetical protein
MMEEKRQLTPADKAKCKWTQEEEYYLQDKWGEVSIKGIAKTLGRSENAIIVRAQRMGLGAHLHADSRVTANQLMKAVYGGKQQGGWTMNRWIENGLPIKKHLVKNSRFKVIDIDDFWKWAEQNKDIVNFSQMEENVLGKEPEWVKQKRRIDIREKFKKTPWTPTEDKKLIQLLDKYEYTYDDLCKALNRTEGAIKRRIITLGLTQRPIRNYDRHWTEEETEKLLVMKSKGHCWEEIGRELNRSGSAVRGKYERLQNPEYCKRYYRNNREKLAAYFQKDMCQHYIKTIGCTAGEENCDDCQQFRRRNPEEKTNTGWNSITSIGAKEILQERYENIG